jgi:hypothetical protein
VLELWPYKVGLKERVAATEKDLRAPEAKLTIRAAFCAGRHTIVERLSASMEDIFINKLPVVHGRARSSRATTVRTAG